MKTHSKVSSILKKSINKIYAIQKYTKVYILAHAEKGSEEDRRRYSTFVSVDQWNKEIHKSNTDQHTNASWQLLQCVTMAVLNGDEVIEFKNEKEFKEWFKITSKISDILPNNYWINY